MATAISQGPAAPARTLRALVAADGTAAAAWPALLARPSASLRDCADAVHALCLVHGRSPGIVDLAHQGETHAALDRWLDLAAAALVEERALIARLTTAVGPLPSTPGQAASEAAILAQRNALHLLARSDRVGCASGAAVAFVLDWMHVRIVLDACARRLSVPHGDDMRAFHAETNALLGTLFVTPAVERAMVFGAQQLLAQHRGLWNLLEARASARENN